MPLEKHRVRIWRPQISSDANGAFRVSGWQDMGIMDATITYSQGTESFMNQKTAGYSANLHTDDLTIEIQEQDRCVAEHDPETTWRITSVIKRAMPLSGRVTITASMSRHTATEDAL